MNRLAVIILNWNGLSLLQQFLPSVVSSLKGTSPLGIEADLIVADNGSTDGSLEWLAREWPAVKVMDLESNHGFAEGYNLAIARAGEYEYVTLLNSDVETPQGWWQPQVDFLQTHPDVGAVQPKILSQKNKALFEYAGGAGGYLDALGYPWCRGRLFDIVEKDEGQYDGAPVEVAWASGAALTTRRKLYLETGGLDPLFFAHMEEIDYCCRLWGKGWKVCALTDCEVYHVGGASLQQGNPQKTYLNFRNNLLLLYKNLPRRRGARLLVARRLADTLAWGMYVAKGDWANAKAVIRAHRDFKKMRGKYSQLPSDDYMKRLPGARRFAVAARFLKRKKALLP